MWTEHRQTTTDAYPIRQDVVIQVIETGEEHPAVHTKVGITMLFGRIGPLVLLSVLPWQRRFAKYPPSKDYPGACKMQIG